MIASLCGDRSGQPQPRRRTVAIGCLIQLIEGAGSMAAFTASEHCAQLRLMPHDVEDALIFCVKRMCKSDAVLEYCMDCRMFLDGVKQAAHRELRNELVAAGEQGMALWEVAADLLKASGIDPQASRSPLVCTEDRLSE